MLLQVGYLLAGKDFLIFVFVFDFKFVDQHKLKVNQMRFTSGPDATDTFIRNQVFGMHYAVCAKYSDTRFSELLVALSKELKTRGESLYKIVYFRKFSEENSAIVHLIQPIQVTE